MSQENCVSSSSNKFFCVLCHHDPWPSLNIYTSVEDCLSHYINKHFSDIAENNRGTIDLWLERHLKYQELLCLSMNRKTRTVPDKNKSLYHGCPICDTIIAVYNITEKKTDHEIQILDLEKDYAGNRRTHINSHLSYYAYECIKCASSGVLFKSSAKPSMKNHIKKIHNITSEPEIEKLIKEMKIDAIEKLIDEEYSVHIKAKKAKAYFDLDHRNKFDLDSKNKFDLDNKNKDQSSNNSNKEIEKKLPIQKDVQTFNLTTIQDIAKTTSNSITTYSTIKPLVINLQSENALPSINTLMIANPFKPSLATINSTAATPATSTTTSQKQFMSLINGHLCLVNKFPSQPNSSIINTQPTSSPSPYSSMPILLVNKPNESNAISETKKINEKKNEMRESEKKSEKSYVAKDRLKNYDKNESNVFLDKFKNVRPKTRDKPKKTNSVRGSLKKPVKRYQKMQNKLKEIQEISTKLEMKRNANKQAARRCRLKRKLINVKNAKKVKCSNYDFDEIVISDSDDNDNDDDDCANLFGTKSILEKSYNLKDESQMIVENHDQDTRKKIRETLFCIARPSKEKEKEKEKEKMINEIDDETKYFCLWCDSLFDNKQLAHNHYMLHCGVCLKCSFCNEQFLSMDQYQKHKEVNHWDTGSVLNFSEFVQSNKWVESFLNNYQEKIKTRESLSTMFCPVCVKETSLFGQNYEQIIHDCDKSIDKTYISNHLHNHLNYFPYECIECSFSDVPTSFCMDFKAKKHLENVHKIKNVDKLTEQELLEFFNKKLNIDRLDKDIEKCIKISLEVHKFYLGGKINENLKKLKTL